MTGTTILTLLGTFGAPTVIAALVAFLGTRSSLRANRPKTEAEADLALANATSQNITAQGNVIDRLTSENQRLNGRLDAVLLRVDALESKLDEAERQTDLANDQLRALERRNVILTEALRQSADWMTRWYDAGHPPGMPPPPDVLPYLK